MIPDAGRWVEKDLDRNLRKLCKAYGFLYYHTYDSRRSPEGYPDVTLAKPKRFILAELKSDEGQPTLDQVSWLDTLIHAIEEVYLWRPGDLDEIGAILAGTKRGLESYTHWYNVRQTR